MSEQERGRLGEDAPAPVAPDSGQTPSGDRTDVGRTGEGAETPLGQVDELGGGAGAGEGVHDSALGGGTADLGGGGDLGGDPAGREEGADPDENRP